jgi:hypothetical protein
MASQDEKLSETRYAIVILRLLLSQSGDLIQGEVTSMRPELHNRFVGWLGLNIALKTLLDRLRQQHTPDNH